MDKNTRLLTFTPLLIQMKKRLYLLLSLMFAFLVVKNISAQEKFKIKEENVTVRTETGTLHGTLLSPKFRGYVPLVIMVQGSGPTDRNGNQVGLTNNHMKMLAEKMAESGIATLRYDKRGVGQSADAALPEEEMRFETLVEDLIAVALEMKDIGKHKFNYCILLGHSQGSLVAMRTARKVNADAFISICGPSKPVDEVIKEQINDQPGQVITEVESVLDSLKNGKKVEEVSPMVYSIVRPSVQDFLMSWMQYDPKKEIEMLYTIPVMIVGGTQDLQVSEADAEILHDHHPNSKLRMIQNMNHVLKEFRGGRARNVQLYSDPEYPISEKLTKEVIDFVLDGWSYEIK